MVFPVLDERALNLGSGARALDCCRFTKKIREINNIRKKRVHLGDNKNFFLLVFFRRPQ